ncbi:MAG: four helix bundle protein [Ekhidna sp.]|uniref:four helix bundle protein n=1 Tax=Ekhidna sp. TaxID=2608089 RepID=UPI0032ECD38A
MQNFKQLEVWKEAHDIALKCYEVYMNFPPEEKYGLTSPMKTTHPPMNALIQKLRTNDK